MTCPCYSNKTYEACCKAFHEGITHPTTALELMRSRYSAYALGLVDYIIATTHPKNPLFLKSQDESKREILHFCANTQFTGLTIVEHSEGKEEAFVTFIAHLAQGGQDSSFKEKSRFLQVDGRWLYEGGVIQPIEELGT